MLMRLITRSVVTGVAVAAITFYFVDKAITDAVNGAWHKD